MVEDSEQFIRFKFEGRLADQSELNFYEAGRFYYGAARLIYTVEAFRQQKRVLTRITSRVNLDARIRTSEPGSFIQDVLMLAAPAIGDCALKVPFEALFSHVWSLLLPAGRSKQEAIEIGQKFVEHGQATAAQLEEVRKIVESGNATTQQALSVLEKVLTTNDSALFRELPLNPEDLASRRDDLTAELEREQVRAPYLDELSRIPAEQERRLSSQVRKSAQEMLVPLRSSARKLDINLSANDNPVAKLDEGTYKIINDEALDEFPTVLRVKMKRFDRETGYGLARYDDLLNPVAFRLQENTKDARDAVLSSMREDEVTGSFYIVRDAYGTPKLLILDQLADLPD